MLKETIDNPRWPHIIKVERKTYSDDPFEDGEETEVLYEGEGRSYTDTTTTGGGTEEERVDVNKRKASIPVRFDKWAKPILAGDTITATMGDVVEQGMVRDFEPDNNRSVVYWEVVRN